MSLGVKEICLTLCFIACSTSLQVEHRSDVMEQKREAFHPWAGKRSLANKDADVINYRTANRMSVDDLLDSLNDSHVRNTVISYLMALTEEKFNLASESRRNKKAFQPWAGRLFNIISIYIINNVAYLCKVIYITTKDS